MREASVGLGGLGLELTRRCNLKCPHCLRRRGGSDTDLPFELICRLLDEARELDAPHVAMTGGEPTIHPQFAAICKAIFERGMTYHFVTNGWNFLDVYPGIERYIENALTTACFSLDGAQAETHDAVRGRGSFLRVMQGVSLCHARDVPFTLQAVVNTLNADELADVALLASNLGAQSVSFGFHQPSPGGVAAGLVPSAEEQRRLRGRLRRLAEALAIHVHLGAAFGRSSVLLDCTSVGLESAGVDCYGRLVLCCEVSGVEGEEGGTPEVVADLREQSLGEGVALLAERVAAFQEQRLRDAAKGRLNTGDEFACWYCLRKLGKMGWLAARESPWAEQVDDAPNAPEVAGHG